MSRYTITINGTARVVDVESTGPGQFSVMVDPTGPAATPVSAPKPAAAPASKPAAAAPAPASVAAAGGVLKAPMPGTIDSINVAVGDQVAVGDTLVVLEAMKMKNDLRSQIAGTVDSVLVAPGQQVKISEVLITFA